MNRKNITTTFFLLVLAQLAFSQTSQDRFHYINKYKQIAQEEMERTGVPASIKLAQAILESNGGKSVLSRKANNHFGIKCGGDWNERSFYRVDDEKDSKGNDIESCFRVYKNPESSFIAHSEFLRSNRRYEFLFELDHKDFHSWAHGLKKAGYATNPKYPALLINIIDNYELYQYDDLFDPGEAPMLASTDDEAMMEQILKAEKKNRKVETKKALSIKKLNDISVVYAEEDDTPETIAIKTDVPMKRIFRYNEILTEPGQVIPENTVVFLQPKRKAYRGRKKFHKVKDGESITQVSQKYGILLDQLQKRNRLAANQEPLEGAILKIRGRRVAKNSRIPTREIYVAGMSNNASDQKKMEKYATSLSDFEAPPSMKDKKEDVVKNTSRSKKRNRFFNFGKRKKKVASAKSAKPSKNIYKASPAYVETKVEEKQETPVYSAPKTSDNYQTETSSSNATFKESLTKVISSSTSTTTVYPPNTNTPSSSKPSTVYDPSTSKTTTSTPTTTTSRTTTDTTYTSTSTPSTSSVVTTPQTVVTQYHTVVKGETLYRLSKTYGKSVDYIKQVNNLNSNTISIGQKLIVN